MVVLKINITGDKRWFQDDTLHRVNNPAIILTNGAKFWYQNNLSHRLDGPSDEYSCDAKYWYYQDQRIDCYSQEEFERLIKLRLLW